MWSRLQRILVPLDFSEESRAALSAALEIAGSRDDGSSGQVATIHVLPDLSPAEPGQMWNTVDDDSRVQHATAALRDWLREGNQEPATVEVCIGDPGAEICRVAVERGTELIVLPSHGRTGLKRLLIGSVAERVVRLAPCPVLVLRHYKGPGGAPSTP